jgi:predicted dehydrogenase
VTALRVAVIGCGAVSEIYHLPALRRCSRGQLTAVVDADATRAANVARRHGAPLAMTDFRELPGKVDAAVIATPNTSHADIACFLLDHDVHVLCEKPLATTLADAQRMARASRRGSARLMAGQCRRFNPNAELVRELIARGHLGTVTQISAALGGRYGQWPQRTDFRRIRALSGGGVLLDLGIHLIDLALWLAGEEARVVRYESTDTMNWGVENDAEVTLEFAGGGRALLACSYTHGLNRTLRVEGTRGWAETSVDGFPAVTFFSEQSRLCQQAGAQHLLVPEADVYGSQMDHFVGAVLDGSPFAVDLDQVLAGVRLVEECYRVARAA